MLYGGVSLAVYINGVVQEFFRLVRSTAPEWPLSTNVDEQVAWFPRVAGGRGDVPPLRGSEVVYRRLGQLLPGGNGVPSDAPIRTRFVVDILSGSSAGGINGIYLAKALANRQSIDRLRQLWVDEGDISELLNDARSYKNLASGLRAQRPPRSLLNGYRLYVRALEALRGMAGTEQRAATGVSPSYADQIDLAVTATDLQGLRVPIKLYDGVVHEPRHKNVFRFAYSTKDATGEERNDFGPENDPMLAFAARCTSSFPFAFEPMVLDDLADVLPRSEFRRDDEPWPQFFRDYTRMGAEYRRYAFADGGYLDNKPFSHASEELTRRRADVPVDRKLVYIEPDPAEALPPDAVAEDPRPRPEVLENVVAALTGLPRKEPIREDIEAVVRRSRAIARLRDVTTSVVDGAAMKVLLGGALPSVFPNDPGLAYDLLRRQIVVDDLGDVLARVAGIALDSDAQYAVHLVARGWAEKLASEELFEDYDLGFRLRRLTFIQRRVNDLLRGSGGASEIAAELDLWQITPETARLLRKVKMALNEIFVELRWRGRGVRKPLHTVELLGSPSMRATNPETVAEDAARFQAVAEAVGVTGLTVQELVARILDPGDGLVRSEDQARARASALAAEQDESLTAVADALRDVFALPFRAADAAALRVLGGEAAADGEADAEGLRWLRGEDEPEAETPRLLEGLDDLPDQLRDLLRCYYEAFGHIDAMLLPLTYPDLGEVNPVEIIRISPQDAKSLIDEVKEGANGRRKLAGTSVHHFGGFLDRTFRVNDILWGRLDGAERIVQTTLPAEHPERKVLVEAAQLGIIDEDLLTQTPEPWVSAAQSRAASVGSTSGASLDELRELLGGDWSDDRLRAALAVRAHLAGEYEVTREPDRRRMMEVVGRGTSIASEVVGAAAEANKAVGRPMFWVGRVGRLLAGLAALATPPSLKYLPRIVFRNIAVIAFLVGIVLIVLGILGVDGAQKAGWVVLAATGVAQIAVWAATAWVGAPDRRPGRRWSRLWRWLVRAAIAVAVSALVVAAAIGVADVIDRIVN